MILGSRSLRWAAAGLALAGVAAAFLVWRYADPIGSNPPGVLRLDDPVMLQRGEQLYQARCASCHGANLEGQANWRERGVDGRLPAPPHDESGHTWHHPDEVLIRITRDGVAKAAGLPDYVSSMPTFGDSLSDADIVAVLSWIKSRWSSDIQAHHDAINRQANQAAQR